MILLHISSGWGIFVTAGTPLEYWNVFCKLVCFWSVPVFVLVSGYCLADRKGALADFYKRRGSRILVPMVAWTVFYLGMRFFTATGLTLRSLSHDMLFGAPYYHLWFLYMITGLYCVTPLCWWLREKLREKSLLLLLGFYLIVWCFPSWWEKPLFHVFFLHFIPYLGLYYTGMLMRRMPVNRSSKLVFGILTVLYFLLIGPLNLYLYITTGEVFQASLTNTGPIAAAGSVSVFAFCLQFRDWRPNSPNRSRVELLASLVFGAYLLHPFILFFQDKPLHLFKPTWIHYFTTVVLTFGFSLGITWVAGKIPILRRIFGVK